MAKSALRQQIETAAPDGDLVWDKFAAAVEILVNTLGGVSLGAPLSQATPGSDATKAIAVQGVTSGKAVAVSGPVTDTQLRATAVPISLATAPVLVAGTALIGKVGIDQTTPGTTNGTTDNGPGWTSANGIAGVPFTSADQHSAVASVTSLPTSGQKLVLTDLVFSVDTAMNVTFKEETSGTVISGPFYMAANTTVQITTRSRRKLPTADKRLQVLTSVAGNIMVNAFYFSEA